MKGVILAGGNGTRLRPLTNITNKHLLPIYDKPMIAYPLETLKSLGIRDIMIVTGGEYIGRFAEYLGDGLKFGVNLTYKVQDKAGGIAQALGLTKDFVKDNKVAVILGDNIFDNSYITIPDCGEQDIIVYGKDVESPERFGVAEFDKGQLVKIHEKPKNPPSRFAITGLYIYPPDVFDVIGSLKPSDRGELEITDVNNFYINAENMHFQKVDGFWSDAGTFDSLLKSSNWVKSN